MFVSFGFYSSDSCIIRVFGCWLVCFVYHLSICLFNILGGPLPSLFPVLYLLVAWHKRVRFLYCSCLGFYSSDSWIVYVSFFFSLHFFAYYTSLSCSICILFPFFGYYSEFLQVRFFIIYVFTQYLGNSSGLSNIPIPVLSMYFGFNMYNSCFTYISCFEHVYFLFYSSTLHVKFLY